MTLNSGAVALQSTLYTGNQSWFIYIPPAQVLYAELIAWNAGVGSQSSVVPESTIHWISGPPTPGRIFPLSENPSILMV
jgi:hypothetical protein